MQCSEYLRRCRTVVNIFCTLPLTRLSSFAAFLPAICNCTWNQPVRLIRTEGKLIVIRFLNASSPQVCWRSSKRRHPTGPLRCSTVNSRTLHALHSWEPYPAFWVQTRKWLPNPLTITWFEYYLSEFCQNESNLFQWPSTTTAIGWAPSLRLVSV